MAHTQATIDRVAAASQQNALMEERKLYFIARNRPATSTTAAQIRWAVAFSESTTRATLYGFEHGSGYVTVPETVTSDANTLVLLRVGPGVQPVTILHFVQVILNQGVRDTTGDGQRFALDLLFALVLTHGGGLDEAAIREEMLAAVSLSLAWRSRYPNHQYIVLPSSSSCVTWTTYV